VAGLNLTYYGSLQPTSNSLAGVMLLILLGAIGATDASAVADEILVKVRVERDGEFAGEVDIEVAQFDAIDELLDLVRISGGDAIVVFHRRRSRRSYAREKRTPRPERKYFLFSRWFTAGTLSLASRGLQAKIHRWPQSQNFDGRLRDQMVGHVGERLLASPIEDC